MAGIKLIGSFNTYDLKDGLQVKMAGCGLMHDGTPYYFFEPIKG